MSRSSAFTTTNTLTDPKCHGRQTDVVAPPPGELFSETNDNSVALLLTYVTTCALLAGDAEATEDLRVRREGDRTAIPAELNSGEYVVEVLLRVPEGDATYYFRVAVEGEGKRPVSSGSTEY